jgi:hypothetical protein
MVESICEQGFAYTHKVKEDWQKKLVKLGLRRDSRRATAEPKKMPPAPWSGAPFYSHINM